MPYSKEFITEIGSNAMTQNWKASHPQQELPDPLDRSQSPLDPARPGDENEPPIPLDQDPEMDPDLVRKETDDGEMSPDDPR